MCSAVLRTTRAVCLLLPSVPAVAQYTLHEVLVLVQHDSVGYFVCGFAALYVQFA